MPADCENWPITVTLLGASGKDECGEQKLDQNDRVNSIHKKKSPGLGQSKRLPDRSPSQLRNRRETVVYQWNAATIFRGKHTIFKLTPMVNTASCRAYCLNDWQL